MARVAYRSMVQVVRETSDCQLRFVRKGRGKLQTSAAAGEQAPAWTQIGMNGQFRSMADRGVVIVGEIREKRGHEREA